MPQKTEYRNRVAKSPSRPVFSVRFTEGLADRNRLPLEHVIRVLNEIKGLMEEVGRRVQRERGDKDADGDFGLELVAGFQKGSVNANIAITRNETVGAIVAQQILKTVNDLGTFSTRRSERSKHTGPTQYDPRMVARLGNIGNVQEKDKTKTVMALRTGVPGKRAIKAVLDNRAVKAVRALREPNLMIEDLTVYGKLRELRDKYDDDEEGRKAFFGELLADDGTVWRVQFKASEGAAVSALFRKQVCITGLATYYKALAPKLVAREYAYDPPKDYETAFDEIFGSSPELVGVDLNTLLGEI